MIPNDQGSEKAWKHNEKNIRSQIPIMQICSVRFIFQCPYTNLFPNVDRIQAKNNLLQQQTHIFHPASEFHKLPLCAPNVLYELIGQSSHRLG